MTKLDNYPLLTHKNTYPVFPTHRGVCGVCFINVIDRQNYIILQ